MPCSELFWLNFLEVFPRVLGFALGILPALLAVGGLIGGIHLWIDRDNRQYTLRLREQNRQLEQRREEDRQRWQAPRSA
jgi:hypothetical protein